MLNDCDLSDDMLARILETKNNHPSLKNIQLSNNYIEWKDDRITNFFIKNKIETLCISYRNPKNFTRIDS